ncbi:GNAT family N-acetyltransferase [Kitasatospora sp. NPDC056181]|uniref:GNAT family N-acetyltransferase n=1 Tax=Kitasatospora sp. NPDC056181 TaxID=3345737 RepID=UPI0035D9D5A4
MPELEIRPASRDQLGEVEALLTGASEWLASRGIDQWQFPPRRDRLVSAMDRGECFLACLDGVPVATFTVDDQADPEFWEASDAPEDALYVHRMAVAREVAGRGLGGNLLDWASDRAAAKGKPFLRLDAWKTNPGLQSYYLGQGFRLVRVVDLPHRPSGALFERAVAGMEGGHKVTGLAGARN